MGSVKVKVAMQRVQIVILFLFIIINVGNAAKVSKAKLKECSKSLKSISATISQLKTNMTELKAEMAKSRSTGTASTDVIQVVDSTIGGYTTKCDAGVITGWTNLLDEFWDDGSTADSATSYFSTSTGYFTAPKAGWYNICAFLRFKKGGDNSDIVIVNQGSIVAAFGDALGDDWRSTGTCLIREMAAADTLYIEQKAASGHSNCIEETGWYYARFTTYLINANS